MPQLSDERYTGHDKASMDDIGDKNLLCLLDTYCVST